MAKTSKSKTLSSSGRNASPDDPTDDELLEAVHAAIDAMEGEALKAKIEKDLAFLKVLLGDDEFRSFMKAREEEQ